MEREAESWFCEESVASTKLSIAESHDDALFNFGIEIDQIDSKGPLVSSEEETEAEKLDTAISNITRHESDTDKEKPVGEMSFSLSLLEANVQAQREAGLAGESKENQVIEEHAEVEVTNFFLWQGNQDETEGSTEEDKPTASNVAASETDQPETIEEEDAGSDFTSIFMWDENKFVEGESEEKQAGKSARNEQFNKKEEDLEMTEYSEAYETFDSQSKVQDASSYEPDESIGASGYEDFIKGLFVQNKSESESETDDDKYGIPEGASSESEVNHSDNYVITSGSEAAASVVSQAASNLTEHSMEVSLDPRVNSIVESDVAEDLSKSYDGTAVDASLDKVISSTGSEGRGTHSFEETIESSAMGTEFQSTFGGTTLDSFEGTMGSTLDGNESSFFGGTAATLTSYDLVDSSFSDDYEDPLNKMLDFAGCMTAPCEDENASISGDRSSKKKKASTNEQSAAVSNGSPGVLTMVADYMKKETPLKHLAHKATCQEEPPRAPLSPRNAPMKSPSIANGKTPRHTNKSVEKESLSSDPAVEALKSVDLTVEDAAVAAPVGTSSGEAGDENAPIAPIETSNTGADTSINTGTCDTSVNTGADTVRAGFQSMHLRNKILLGARQKMESAMISRHQRAGLQEFAAMKRSNYAPRKQFPSIKEDTECKDGSKDMTALRRQRWARPDRDFLSNKKKSRRRNKKQHHHTASETLDTK